MAKPTRKTDEIRKLQSDIMGVDVRASIEGNICVSCRRKVAVFADEQSRREYGISGLCQGCQDDVFGGPERG